MKTIFLFLWVFLISNFCLGQTLKIKLHNKTSYDLDSISVGDAYIGFIKKGASITTLECTELTMQDGAPFGLTEGYIDGKTKNTNPINLSRAGVSHVTEGEYEFDIKVIDRKEGYRLYWERHQ